MTGPDADEWFTPGRPTSREFSVLADIVLSLDAASEEGTSDALVDRWLGVERERAQRMAIPEAQQVLDLSQHRSLQDQVTIAWVTGFGAGVRTKRGTPIPVNTGLDTVAGLMYGGLDPDTVSYIARQRGMRIVPSGAGSATPPVVAAAAAWWEGFVVGMAYDEHAVAVTGIKPPPDVPSVSPAEVTRFAREPGAKWGDRFVGRFPTKGKHDFPLHFTKISTPDGRTPGVGFTRVSGSFELRKMAANAVAAGYQSPLDFRLLITLDPDGANILAGDLQSLPYESLSDRPVLPDDAEFSEPPITVLGNLVYPGSEHPFRVMFQVRLRDFLSLPPLSFARLPADMTVEQPGDALWWFRLTLDDFTPVPPQDAAAASPFVFNAFLQEDDSNPQKPPPDYFDSIAGELPRKDKRNPNLRDTTDG